MARGSPIRHFEQEEGPLDEVDEGVQYSLKFVVQKSQEQVNYVPAGYSREWHTDWRPCNKSVPA